MKKIFILIGLFILAFSANAFAQKKKPAAAKQMTAKQLFLALPDDYVVGAERAKNNLVFPKQMKSDFLTFMVASEQVPKVMAGDFKKPEGLGNLRVFRGKDKTIVGLRYQIGDSAEENPSVDSVKVFTYLLEYKNGKWTDVTAALLPKVSIDDAYKTVSEIENTKNAKKEDVWIETQVSPDQNGLQNLIRVKGSDWVTPLKFYKWNGTKFVETQEP